MESYSLGGAVHLSLNRLPALVDVLNLGSDPLGRSSERVAILAKRALVFGDAEVNFVPMVACKLARLQHDGNGVCAFDLSGVWPADVVNKRGKRAIRPVEGFDGHGRRDLREEAEHRSVMDGERGNGAGEGRAVEDTQRLLRLECCGFNLALLEGFTGGYLFTSTVGPINPSLDARLAGNCPSDIAERAQISAGRDGASEWDDWRDVVGEDRLHLLEDLPSDAGMAAHQAVEPHQDRASHPGLGLRKLVSRERQ